MAIWNILRIFGIFYDLLEHFEFIWYIFFRFWYHVTRKIWQTWRRERERERQRWSKALLLVRCRCRPNKNVVDCCFQNPLPAKVFFTNAVYAKNRAAHTRVWTPPPPLVHPHLSLSLSLSLSLFLSLSLSEHCKDTQHSYNCFRQF
jgi:hypothetical protein